MLVARFLQKDVFSCNIVWLHFWCLTADSTQALPLPIFPFYPPFRQAGNKAQGPFLWHMQEFQTTQAQVSRQGSSEPISLSKHYKSQTSLLTLVSQDTFHLLESLPCVPPKASLCDQEEFLYSLGVHVASSAFDIQTKLWVGSIPLKESGHSISKWKTLSTLSDFNPHLS